MTKKKDPFENFDLDGSDEPVVDVAALKSEKEYYEKLAFQYEAVIRANGLSDQLGKEFSDEEFICVKGIETIKKLVINQIATKDDINMFDILYRNLNVIRGVKVPNMKKEKPKSREELVAIAKGVSIVNGGKS